MMYAHGIVSQIIDDWKKYNPEWIEEDFNVQTLMNPSDEYGYHEMVGIIRVYVNCEYVGEITMWNEPGYVLIESRFYANVTKVAMTNEYKVKFNDEEVPELIGWDEFDAAMQEW